MFVSGGGIAKRGNGVAHIQRHRCQTWKRDGLWVGASGSCGWGTEGACGAILTADVGRSKELPSAAQEIAWQRDGFGQGLQNLTVMGVVPDDLPTNKGVGSTMVGAGLRRESGGARGWSAGTAGSRKRDTGWTMPKGAADQKRVRTRHPHRNLNYSSGPSSRIKCVKAIWMVVYITDPVY